MTAVRPGPGPAETAGESSREALLLPLGRDWYALPLVEVREVLPVPGVTPVPGGPRWLVGVANLRGQILPVVDTAARLGVARGGEVTHVAVVDSARGDVGLAATGAPERTRLGQPSGPATGRAAVARYAVGERIATLLDLGELLAPGADGAGP